MAPAISANDIVFARNACTRPQAETRSQYTVYKCDTWWRWCHVSALGRARFTQLFKNDVAWRCNPFFKIRVQLCGNGSSVRLILRKTCSELNPAVRSLRCPH